MRQLTGTVALVFLMCLAANAGVIVVNFETVPVIPAVTSLFDEAGPMQTIIVSECCYVYGWRGSRKCEQLPG